jgi:ribokinase
MAVAVFGSINMDLVVRTPRLPVAGETLTGHTFFTAPGGKGANQAVACARLGATAHMIGRVGGDVFGGALRESLAGNGVDTTGVLTDASQPSGVAVIAVDDQAENTIIIVPGANGTVGEADVERLQGALAAARALLLQLEVPMAAVVAAARAARERGVMVILDPAPARPLPDELYQLTDLITPNEVEAGMLTGLEVRGEADADRAAKVLVQRGARGAAIKMGGKGAYYFDGRAGTFWPAFKVKAIDSVAAGDAFNGALASAVADGRPVAEALRWGMAAGALSTTKAGAQPSMPDRAAVETLLKS